MISHAPPGSARAAPDVRIVSGHAGIHGDAFGVRDSLHVRPVSRDPHASMVVWLLGASTTLALYDLFVLVSALVPSAHP
ncbi:MAG: hypothetical protein QOE31_281 [Solirubrobacteraceae bacterium]|jgi:hypothetical protein|nr:hypothetical protein [Solirubrobacteraceae bacterium]